MSMPFSVTEVMLLLGLAALLAVGGFLGYRRWRRVVAQRARLKLIREIAFDMLQDVLVPDGNGSHLHVDFILLTAAGLLVLDLRDVQGMIFGSESMDEWTVMDGTRRLTFSNPLGPLYDRMAAVRLAAGEVPVAGRVVFSGRGSFPKGRPPKVTMLDALSREFAVAEAAAVAADGRWSTQWAALKGATLPSPLARRR